MQSHRRQPTRLPRPWDSPGKNAGVGCHFLLQCMKVKSQNEVAQSCPTLSDPMDCSPPGSSVHGIFQARVLEWGAIAFSSSSPHYFFYFQLIPLCAFSDCCLHQPLPLLCPSSALLRVRFSGVIPLGLMLAALGYDSSSRTGSIML